MPRGCRQAPFKEAGGGSAGEDGDIQRRGSGEEGVGEGRDERYLPAAVLAGDDLEDDEYEREIDDREPEEGFEGFPHPVAVETGVLEGVDPEDEHRKVGRGEVAHVGDDTGAYRHPGKGPGIGEHHQDGGEGEEGEEPCVAGADRGQRRASPGAAVPRRVATDDRVGDGLCHHRLRDLTAHRRLLPGGYGVSLPASRVRPLSVTRYFWLLLRGLSGMVISINPACISGFSTEFLNLVRFVLPAMSISSDMDVSATQVRNISTWSSLSPNLVPTWSPV